MNRQAAFEWLRIAYHDLRSAQILYDAGHYTDSIGSDLQQCMEKTFKSYLAYENRKIPKTHDLYELYTTLGIEEFTDRELDLLDIATNYLKEERYPNPHYSLPSRDEIAEVISFAKRVFEQACKRLQIDPKEIERG